MVVFISWVLTRAIKAKTGIDSAIVMILLFMMIAMLIGPGLLYLYTLSFTLDDVVVWEIAVFMSAGMMPIAALIATQLWFEGEPERGSKPPLSSLLDHVSLVRGSYIVLLVLGEFLMGWTFDLGSGLLHLSSGYSLMDVAKELQYSITTYWFLFTMVGEMSLSLFALRKIIRRNLLNVLAVQAVVMLLTPTAIDSKLWETWTLYLEAAVMTGVVVLAVVLLRRQDRDPPTLKYLGLFIVANAIMIAGFLIWVADGDSLLLALSLIAQTFIYFDAVFTGAGLGETFHG